MPCPGCKAADCPAHYTAEKTWRHLDFLQHQAFLQARTSRIKCSKCGVRGVEVPWARPGSGFTLLFEMLAMTLIIHMPVAAASRTGEICIDLSGIYITGATENLTEVEIT